MATNFIIVKRTVNLSTVILFQIDFGTIIQVPMDPIIQDSTDSSEILLFSFDSLILAFFHRSSCERIYRVFIAEHHQNFQWIESVFHFQTKFVSKILNNCNFVSFLKNNCVCEFSIFVWSKFLCADNEGIENIKSQPIRLCKQIPL